MKKTILILSVLSFLHSFGQGCSDAGVCSIYALDSTSSYRSFLSIGSSYEVGESGFTIISPQLRIMTPISSRLSFDAKLPLWIASSSDYGSVSGLNDPILKFSYDLKNLVFIFGTRIGVNNANLQSEGVSIPMAGQSSLGTTDLLLGFSKTIKDKLSLSLAAQIPLSQYNENQDVVARYVIDYDLIPVAERTNYQFRRKTDIMFKADYSFHVGKGRINVGILPIYHVEDDIIQHQSDEELNTTIIGSKGFTVNIPFGYSLPLSERWQLELDGGFPIITRKERPDGLTRSFVLFLNLKYRFNKK